MNAAAAVYSRTPRDAAAVRDALAERYRPVYVMPLLSFGDRPPRIHEERSLFDTIESFDVLAFTSPRAVESLARLRHAEGRSWPRGPRCRAGGPSTRRALESVGQAAEAELGELGAGALARSLLEELDPSDRVLFVSAREPRAEFEAAFRAAGRPVDRLAVYETRECPWAPEFCAGLEGRRVTTVVTSPRAFHALSCSAFEEPATTLTTWRIVAGGHTTARAMREAGLEPAAVSEDPRDEALVNAMLSVAEEER